MTSIGWHESNLAEDRVPTLAELDAAVPDHPVPARRGGHFAVVNSAALQAAGVGPGTPDPPGGKIRRLADGSRDGVLEGGAVYQVAAFAPVPGRAELAAALGTCSASYAALGTGTIREAMATHDDFLAYQDAWERRLLNVRARLMIRVGSELSGDEALALIRGLGARSGFGDDRLRIWGLKFVMDGGAEGAALDQPYASDPANSGHLHDEFTTSRILVLELLDGVPLGRADGLMAERGIDRAALARTLLRCLLRQIMVDGVFHADPRPGNILVLADGHLALLDFGSVGHLDTELQSAMFGLVPAIDRRDPAALRDAFVEITDSSAELDGQALERSLGRLMARYLGPGLIPDTEAFGAIFRMVSAYGSPFRPRSLRSSGPSRHCRAPSPAWPRASTSSRSRSASRTARSPRSSHQRP